tara:strand:+ start:43159 stop:43950 length:792 start_codon:yes stop_codon:yes gene_type:complete
MKAKITTLIFFIFCIYNAQSSVVVLNGLTHVYKGISGDVIIGEVILVNNSNIEQRVTFDLNDAIFSCSSNRFFTNETTHSQSSKDWFRAELMNKTLMPKEKYIYKYTITIPNDQNIKGSFWSMLMVNIEKPIKEEALNNNVGLDTKIRYAVALLTNVNSYDEVNLDFKNIDFNEDSNSAKKELNVKIFNESLFIEGVRLTLEVYNNEGIKIYESITDRNMAFPGFCKDYQLDISDLPQGEYECVLIADSREEFLGANITLTID